MHIIIFLTVLMLLILSIWFLQIFKALGVSREYIEKVDKIPGPKPLPFLGHFFEVTRISGRDAIYFGQRRYEKYGPINKMVMFNFACINLSSPESFEVIVGGMKHLEKSFIYIFLQEWLGKGLLTSKGAKWQSHRKLLTPAFHFTILENFQGVMVDKSHILIKCLENASSAGQVFNVFPYIKNAALDIISETAMGTNIRAQENPHSEYASAVYKLSEILIHRAVKPWLMIDQVFKLSSSGRKWTSSLRTLHEFTERIIRERKEARKTVTENIKPSEDIDADIGKKKKVAFLDLLLDVADKDSSLTDLDIREEVDTFMFAGHDTTAAAISWVIYLIGRHPDVQEKVYQELQGICESNDKTITYNDLNEMKYLERVIKESLRLYPPVPHMGRKLESDCEVHGYTIPAGAFITFHLYLLHRNPKYFPNPEKFNPDNFLPENIKDRHPYAYLPFSMGPRNCIGQKFAMIEEKMILASIIRKFKIKSIDDPQDIQLVSEMVLRSENGINITLESR